jgi:hypothetical protein
VPYNNFIHQVPTDLPKCIGALSTWINTINTPRRIPPANDAKTCQDVPHFIFSVPDIRILYYFDRVFTRCQFRSLVIFALLV